MTFTRRNHNIVNKKKEIENQRLQAEREIAMEVERKKKEALAKQKEEQQRLEQQKVEQQRLEQQKVEQPQEDSDDEIADEIDPRVLAKYLKKMKKKSM